MNIVDSTVEKLEDPFGILHGERFEIILTLDIDEEDELYSDHGTKLKLIYAVEDGEGKVAQYNFIEQTSEQVLDFALEEEEEMQVNEFCQELIHNFK